MKTPVDVLIVGGGPAGLTAALTLMRQRHTAIMFDSGIYRNGHSSFIHMVPGWDHCNPADFRAAAKKQALTYYKGLTVEDCEVKSILKDKDGLFTLENTAGKTWRGRKVLLATGNANIFPAINGYADSWTRRIYHCLFCGGYEDSIAPSAGALAVDFLGNKDHAIKAARMCANLSRRVTIYTNGAAELSKEVKPLAEGQFRVDDRAITRMVPADDHITLEFADGESVQETFLMHNPLTKPNGPFIEQLGIETTPQGNIKADLPHYTTNVPGVYAAGDLVTPVKVATIAIASGCAAAAGVSAELDTERTFSAILA